MQGLAVGAIAKFPLHMRVCIRHGARRCANELVRSAGGPILASPVVGADQIVPDRLEFRTKRVCRIIFVIMSHAFAPLPCGAP